MFGTGSVERGLENAGVKRSMSFEDCDLYKYMQVHTSTLEDCMRKDVTKSVGWKRAQQKSIATSNRKKRENELKYLKNPKRCGFCDEVIPYEKRLNNFCRSSCSASFNNMGVRRHGTGSQTSSCLNCKKTFEYDWHKHSGKFCSSKCSGIFKSAVMKREWLAGGKNVGRQSIRRYLKEERGNVCSVMGCGVSSWMGKEITLIVDHIDGNAGNDNPDNVRLICPNCNSQTDTFSGRNKGNGRKSRGLPR